MPALLSGQAFAVGEGVGAQPGVLGFEGGDEPGAAVPPAALPFGACFSAFRLLSFRYVTYVVKRAYRYVAGLLR